MAPVEFAIDFAADVLVLGGGPAGAWAALAAARAGASVALADKGRLGTSGATAAVNTAVVHVAPRSEERRQVIERRVDRGLGLARAETIDAVLDEAWHGLLQLPEWGYAFPRDDDGEIYRGTLRGPDYMQILRRRLHKAGVKILDHSPAVALLRDNEGVAGGWGYQRVAAKPWRIQAGAVVIATGGCAFQSKALGTYGLTGDGLLMAGELGAVLSGMEFSGQYGISHVSATVTKNLIYCWATFSDQAGNPLEGGDAFELLARNLPNGPVYALIDKATPSIREGLRRGQPNIFLALDRQGIDPFTQRFPVTLRYEGTVRGVGGLLIDSQAATTVPGLFAAGDAASREALVGATSGGGGPNSTWAIASGSWAGRAAAAFARQPGRAGLQRLAPGVAEADLPILDENEHRESLTAIQGELFPVERNFTRSGPGMRRSLEILDAVWRRTAEVRRQRPPADQVLGALRGRELAAMAATARWIYASALARTETRGIHRRRDYAATAAGQARSLYVSGLDTIAVTAEAKQ